MTVEDLIRAKEEATSVVYQSFVLLTGSNPNDLFCFIEGKDAPYYHFRIKSNIQGEVHYLTCKGKKRVLKTKELIEHHREYDKYRTAFFVDKDFDISLKNKFPNLYETPCYSIENLYCTPQSVKEIIKCEFQITEDEPAYSVILNLYEKLHVDFLNSMLFFNAWYSIQKKKQTETGESNNVSLENELPRGFISISLEQINSDYDLEKIRNTFPNSHEVTEEEVQAEIDELIKKDLCLFLRGKYVLTFLIDFIRLIVSDSCDKTQNKYLSRKIKLNLDRSTVLSTLSPYAITPNCLDEFVRNLN